MAGRIGEPQQEFVETPGVLVRLVGKVVPNDFVAFARVFGRRGDVGVGRARQKPSPEFPKGGPHPFFAFDFEKEGAIKKLVEPTPQNAGFAAPIGGEETPLILRLADRQPAKIAGALGQAQRRQNAAAVEVDERQVVDREGREGPRQQHVANRKIAMEKPGIVHAADGAAEQLQEKWPVERGIFFEEASFVACTQEVTRFDPLFQERRHKKRGPVFPLRFDPEQRLGGGNAGRGEGAGHFPAAFGLTAAPTFFETAAQAGVAKLFDHHLERPRRGVEAGAEHVVASPVQGFGRRLGVGELPHNGGDRVPPKQEPARHFAVVTRNDELFEHQTSRMSKCS